MNPVLTVVFPVEVSLDEAFGQNLVRTLESTAVDKLRQQESLPLNHMCQMFREQEGGGRGGFQRANSLTQSDTGVKLLASSSLLLSHSGNAVTETYKMSNVRLPERDWNPPKLDFQILGKDGAVLWEHIFSRESYHDQEKAVVLPEVNPTALFLPWTLVRDNRGCVFIARRSNFNIIAEIDPATLRDADRASVKFAQ